MKTGGRPHQQRDSFRRRQILDASARLDILARDPGADSAAVLADTEAALEALRRQEDASALPDIISAPALAQAEVPIPLELVSGLLHQGSKLIVGGSSKSYKTWALIDLALAVSTGSPWLGFNTTAGKVLYVNLEIQAGFFRGRLLDVAQAKGIELSSRLDTWNLRGWAADYRVLIPKIRTRIRDQGHALVIIDPTYKLLGTADENSATDMSALLNMVENLAVTTGTAVALAGHFAKGNASGKETIDRISGSGVFARDPDGLIAFTRHEEEGVFAVEMVLRNLPPVKAFVVRWDWPLFNRADDLDPSKLKQVGGRPVSYTTDMLLETLGDHSLTTGEWEVLCFEEHGIKHTKFHALRNALKRAKKVQKSMVDDKWRQIRAESRNPYND